MEIPLDLGKLEIKKLNSQDDIFIWTEGINCGPILENALKSFDKHHKNLKINIFIDQNSQIFYQPRNNTFNYIKISELDKSKFNSGHYGTASLWSNIIKNSSAKYFIHFDSDVIFFKNIVENVVEKIYQGYDLIGPIRNYKNNPYNIECYRTLPDTVSTYLFAFNKKKINKKFLSNNSINFFKIFNMNNLNIKNDLINFNTDYLTSIILGNNPNKIRFIDFFDPVSYEIISNGGKIYIIDPDLVGGCDHLGKRATSFSNLNNLDDEFKIDYGSAMCHFSSVGSGYHFENNPNKIKNIPNSYVKYAINRYNLYKYLTLNDNQVLDIQEFKYFHDFEKFRKNFLY